MRVLVTGGAGYIGTHTLVEVLSAGHEALVVDDYSRSKPAALERVRQITNRSFAVETADICDFDRMTAIARDFAPEATIHLAGLKAVGESVARPLAYFAVNVGGTLSVLRALETCGCRRFVFSSSATVYGEPAYLPIDELHPLRSTSPYGRSKLHAEGMLEDLVASDPVWSVALLRYFNPAGAHASGRIGEDPAGTPNNLMPFVAQVAAGRRVELVVFGDDYPTPDGTGVRDYLHVTDLARAHVAALDWTGANRGCEAFNLGLGRGASVYGLVQAFAAAAGREIALRVAPRRPGDVAACYADPAKAARALGWTAERPLEEMCASVWRWQSANPQGYDDVDRAKASG